MKKLLSLITLFSLALTLSAIPAKRVSKTVSINGRTVTLTYQGDEHCKYYVGNDGLRYRAVEGGCFAPISDTEFTTMRQHAELRRTATDQRRLARAKKAQRHGIAPATEGQYEGKKKGLVILVNYSDVKMKSGSTSSAFNDMMNKEGYNKNGHIGSVHDYFKDQSYGKFDLTFDVVGPVQVSKTMAYYGKNDGDGNDVHPAEMVIEACKLADEFVDYKDYDWDGDGEVDQVYLIYAGYGEASGDGVDNTIWPHEWTLSEAKTWHDGTGAQTLDGVTIDTYACSSELYGTMGSTMDGIGTACHEFSHCMGLPDLYDTSGGSNFGMDAWSLMDYGAYNNDGSIPAAYTAYERMYAGWLKPTVLSEETQVKGMKPITSSTDSYIIYNEKNNNEYYILQNTQQEGWNAGAYGHGLLIIHVDYKASVWEENTVNNVSSRQRCTIFHADNNTSTTSSGLAGDPYPGTKRNTKLTDSSTPAATLYNANADGKKLMGKPITDITESMGTISFSFNKSEGGGGEGGDEDFTGDEIIFDFNANEWNLPESTDQDPHEITEVKKNGATINFTSGGTITRIWNDVKDGPQLRIYKGGGSLTVNAPKGRFIEYIKFEGNGIYMTDEKGKTVGTTWTSWSNEVSSQTFTITGTSKINVITVHLLPVVEGINVIGQQNNCSTPYDLTGRNMYKTSSSARPAHGIYIENGRKILR